MYTEGKTHKRLRCLPISSHVCINRISGPSRKMVFAAIALGNRTGLENPVARISVQTLLQCVFILLLNALTNNQACAQKSDCSKGLRPRIPFPNV